MALNVIAPVLSSPLPRDPFLFFTFFASNSFRKKASAFVVQNEYVACHPEPQLARPLILRSSSRSARCGSRGCHTRPTRPPLSTIAWAAAARATLNTRIARAAAAHGRKPHNHTSTIVWANCR